jgi:hypothetical protein
MLWTRKIIVVFARALHWYLSWTRSVQSIPPNTVSIRSILILFAHLCLSLPSSLLPSDFPTKNLFALPLLPHSCYMPCPYHPPWVDHCNYTWRSVKFMALLITKYSPTPAISSFLRSGRSLHSKRFLVFSCIRLWVDPRAIVRLEWLGELKISNDQIGNRICDLPACCVMPQATTLSRAPSSRKNREQFR